MTDMSNDGLNYPKNLVEAVNALRSENDGLKERLRQLEIYNKQMTTALEEIHSPHKFCQQCGTRNFLWAVDDALLEETVVLNGTPFSLFCPTCFIRYYERAHPNTTWRLVIDGGKL